MNDKQYEQVKRHYIRYTDDEFMTFMRQHAFEELDAQIECIYNNMPEAEADRFMDSLTEEIVGSIVEDYIERLYNDSGWLRDKMMRAAIEGQTGFIC